MFIDKLETNATTPSFGVSKKFSDDVSKIIGKVRLNLTDLDTNELIAQHSHNQVVYLGRHRLTRILCGGGIAANESVLNVIKFADGAVSNGGDHLSPNPPNVTDTGLFQSDVAKIKTFSLATPSFNAVNSTTIPTATFSITLTTNDILGIINETGIFFGTTGPIFAHYTFPTMDLRPGTNNELRVEWEFDF